MGLAGSRSFHFQFSPPYQIRKHRVQVHFSGYTRRILEQAINALKGTSAEPKAESPAAAEQAKTITELERQAVDLELKAKELRSRIAALKLTTEQGGQAPQSTSGTAMSNTSH